MISDPVPVSELHTYSRNPMHRSIARLQDQVKALIELDENYGLSRFSIVAHVYGEYPSVQFHAPMEAQKAFGTEWAQSSDSKRLRHRFERLVGGVCVFFEIPFHATGEATHPPMQEGAR